jgi:prolipoprotein diacylglyceryltransferase
MQEPSREHPIVFELGPLKIRSYTLAGAGVALAMLAVCGLCLVALLWGLSLNIPEVLRELARSTLDRLT